ncbi:haloacid dehalogenase type II [Xanthomonas sp. WHRI 1810A]|uniref:haloacid dehalogenase type II n=1 Tax=Xanthomonas sp. WHRI 1810A TaxID=3161565 RepID=UPI0032E932C4
MNSPTACFSLSVSRTVIASPSTQARATRPNPEGSRMLKHIVFDVNETLLDLAALDPVFERVFGDSRVRTEWFLTLEECWMTNTITGQYQAFSELAMGALQMMGLRLNTPVGEDDCQALANGLKVLPPHKDVYPALQLLKDNGCALIALSNGALEALQQQLASAGLTECFDHIMAGSEINQFKPAPECYQMVAQRLGITTEQMMMVAAHAWDIAGAARAGCRTAFVERPGKVLNPVGTQPDLTGTDVYDVARQIISGRGD